MIPFAVTIKQAAAPHSSLAFMFWFAGIIVFPLMLIYTAVSLNAFRGKISLAADHY
jgi:cytochrome d ubiquinol oxidase subunit II